MNKKQIKRGILVIKKTSCVLMCVILLLSFCIPAYAENPTQIRKTVRVGYFQYDGFYNVGNGGDKSGYGYDLLQKLRIYENWNYKYIGYDKNTSWKDMIELLNNEEIDLLAPLTYTEENAKKFDYSSQPIGYSETHLSVKSNNKKYSTNDYSNWTNISVGMIESKDNNSFQSYAEEHNITYNSVICKNAVELSEKLQSGEVDMVSTDSMLNLQDSWILDEFDRQAVYYVVKKGNTELLKQINDGISKLSKADPNYDDKLYQKYFTNNSANRIQFSDEEQEYIDNAAKNDKIFYAAINPNRKPLSYYENNNVNGLLTDICTQIFARTGLDIRFMDLDTREKYYEAVDNKLVDIIGDYTGSSSKAENNNLVLLNPYYSSTTSRLTRRDYDGKGNRCAIAGNSISGWLQGLGYEFVYVDSVEDCCKAVKEGSADFTFSYTRAIQDMVYDDETNSLMALSDNNQLTEFSMAITDSSDSLLGSILQKGINSISSDDISKISDSYTYYDQNNTSIKTIMYRNPLVFGVLIFLASALIFGIAILISVWRRKNTEIKNSEKLKEALHKAEISTKEKNEFYSRMSHDMRTPMNGILGISQLSVDENSVYVLQDNMKKICNSGKYLLCLINDTLDLQRIESGKLVLEPKVVLAKEFILNAIESIKKMADEKKLNFKIVTSGVNLDTYIRIDPMRVQQIFTNLLSNAVKFTPCGGTVELSISELKKDGNISHERVTVTDTGLGISENYIKNRIYQPFSQEHNQLTDNYAGSGLGLSIVKNLVDIMGASISVDSELGVGTKFTVDLNIELVDEKDIVQIKKYENIEKSTIAAKLKGTKILLAEDHPLNSEIVKKMLNKVGCSVVWAKNGFECVDKFRNSKENEFDAILMDIRMPEMDGLTASKMIRESANPDSKSIPIVALSANAYKEDIKASLNAGMNAHIAKPVNPSLLYQILSEQIYKHK